MQGRGCARKPPRLVSSVIPGPRPVCFRRGYSSLATPCLPAGFWFSSGCPCFSRATLAVAVTTLSLFSNGQGNAQRHYTYSFPRLAYGSPSSNVPLVWDYPSSPAVLLTNLLSSVGTTITPGNATLPFTYFGLVDAQWPAQMSGQRHAATPQMNAAF